jgi:hypothetical protein
MLILRVRLFFRLQAGCGNQSGVVHRTVASLSVGLLPLTAEDWPAQHEREGRRSGRYCRMNKAHIVSKLHAITDHYLLVAGTWPLEPEQLNSFWAMIREFELEEDVPNSPGTTRSTALGNDVNLELMMAFVGAYELLEIPGILESNGLLTEAETDEIYWRPWENEEEAQIHGCVFRAYMRFAIGLSF